MFRYHQYIYTYTSCRLVPAAWLVVIHEPILQAIAYIHWTTCNDAAMAGRPALEVAVDLHSSLNVTQDNSESLKVSMGDQTCKASAANHTFQTHATW